MLNALSIDVEEYFQVTGLEKVIQRSDWDGISSRLMIGMSRILSIFRACDVKATFFFLGWIADRFPDVVRQVADEGHEIASHGYWHRLVYEQTPADFEQDIARSLESLSKAYAGPVAGYRAPSFSIRTDSLWALDILKKLGFQYDSSIFPFQRKRYGIAGSPTQPYPVRDGLWEFPMSTVKVLGRTIPVCGGGYFRLYPYWLTRWAISKSNQQLGQPVVIYLHPWEFDPEQPRVKADFMNVFRHRVNLHRTASRLERVCREFRFAPVGEVLRQFSERTTDSALPV